MNDMQFADRWGYTEVHYSTEWNCWLVTAYNGNGSQVGDSDTEYRKADAIDTAQGYLDSGRCDAIHVYTKAGTHSRTIGSLAT